MSLAVQRTTYSPGAFQLFTTALALGPKEKSPKSQAYATVSPFASAAVAVKLTGVVTATLHGSPAISRVGGVLSGNRPKFTCTSIHFSGPRVPFPMGVI